MKEQTLFNYQAEGAATLVKILNTSRDAAAMLCDPPGAGKTAQALEVINKLKVESVLIICPASLRLNWEREIKNWLPGKKVVVLLSGKTEIPEKFDILITSYSLASTLPLSEKLRSIYWDFLICDEAHALKSPTSQQTKVILTEIWPKALYRLAITGTPVPNGRASEAYPLFSRMNFQAFGDWGKYCSNYCVPQQTYYGGLTYPWSKNLDELGAIAKTNFMVRRSRDEVLSELPDLTRSVVPLAVSSSWVSEIENDIEIVEVLDGIEQGRPSMSASVSSARRAVGLIKVTPAVEFIKQVLTEDDHVVVFCHHVDVFNAIKIAFDKARISTVEISGSTLPEARQKAVDNFQKGEARVFLGSITAANTGITLTKASTVIFVEADWVPSTNEQAEGRIRRIGQQEIMRAIYLVVPNSLDEAILSAVLRKQKNINTLMMET